MNNEVREKLWNGVCRVVCARNDCKDPKVAASWATTCVVEMDKAFGGGGEKGVLGGGVLEMKGGVK